MACQIQPATGRRPPETAAGRTDSENESRGMLDNVKDAPSKAVEGVTGWFSNLRNFLVEVRNELKRVTWPSRKEVYATTMVVILTSVFFGVYLWGLDQLFETSVVRLFQYFGAK